MNGVGNKAIIAGASGLIGGNLLNILLQQPGYDEVLVLVRKELPIEHPKLKQQVIDFEHLEAYSELIKGNVIFCCLGSTRSKTPDLKEYRKIDYDYPLQLAVIGHRNKISKYFLVSSIGADASSSNFYTKIKGETEASVIKIALPVLHIFRPSALTGDRKENRFAESIFTAILKIVNPLLLGSLKKYRSIPASTVAAAMYKQSLQTEEGIFIHSSEEIKKLT